MPSPPSMLGSAAEETASLSSTVMAATNMPRKPISGLISKLLLFLADVARELFHGTDC